MSFLRVQACPSNDHAITNRVFVADADYRKLRRAADDARARRAEPARGPSRSPPRARGLAPRLRARVLGSSRARRRGSGRRRGAARRRAAAARRCVPFFAAAGEQVSPGAVALNRIQRWLAALEIDAPARVEPDDADVGSRAGRWAAHRHVLRRRAEQGADRLALAQFALAFGGEVFVVGQRVAMRVKNRLMVLCVQRLWTATAAGDGARGRLSRKLDPVPSRRAEARWRALGRVQGTPHGPRIRDGAATADRPAGRREARSHSSARRGTPPHRPPRRRAPSCLSSTEHIFQAAALLLWRRRPSGAARPRARRPRRRSGRRRPRRRRQRRGRAAGSAAAAASSAACSETSIASTAFATVAWSITPRQSPTPSSRRPEPAWRRRAARARDEALAVGGVSARLADELGERRVVDRLAALPPREVPVGEVVRRRRSTRPARGRRRCRRRRSPRASWRAGRARSPSSCAWPRSWRSARPRDCATTK